VSYGVGTGPVLDAIGNATVPSAGFTITLSNAPAGLAAIFYDFGAACPAVPLAGAPMYLPFGPTWGLVGPFGIAGTLSLPAALPGPPVLPAGVTVMLQGLVQAAGGGFSTSNALAFTTALP